MKAIPVDILYGQLGKYLKKKRKWMMHLYRGKISHIRRGGKLAGSLAGKMASVAGAECPKE